MRRLSTLLIFGAAAVGACNGPISDWPPKASDESNTGNPNPVTSTGGGGSTVGGVGSVPGGSVPGGGAPGGTTTPNTPSGASDGGATTSPLGGLVGGGTAGAGSLGGVTGGSNPSTGADAGAPLQDASAPTLDGGGSPQTPDADVPDAIVPDGAVPDAGCSLAPDAGPIGLGDGGFTTSCPAFGCGVTLDSLSASSRPGGACVGSEALAAACSGELSRAAVECTQENALSLGVGRAVTSCMRRLPKLARVPGDCVQCYADETLCTLSRCFVACIDGRDPACDMCRRQSCGESFEKCSGLKR